MLDGTLTLNEQESTGNYDFSISESYMTKGFQDTFGDDAVLMASIATQKIMETYPDCADYFQTFIYEYANGEKVKFWCIHDEDHYTLLLPSEY